MVRVEGRCNSSISSSRRFGQNLGMKNFQTVQFRSADQQPGQPPGESHFGIFSHKILCDEILLTPSLYFVHNVLLHSVKKFQTIKANLNQTLFLLYFTNTFAVGPVSSLCTYTRVEMQLCNATMCCNCHQHAPTFFKFILQHIKQSRTTIRNSFHEEVVAFLMSFDHYQQTVFSDILPHLEIHVSQSCTIQLSTALRMIVLAQC